MQNTIKSILSHPILPAAAVFLTYKWYINAVGDLEKVEGSMVLPDKVHYVKHRKDSNWRFFSNRGDIPGDELEVASMDEVSSLFRRQWLQGAKVDLTIRLRLQHNREDIRFRSDSLVPYGKLYNASKVFSICSDREGHAPTVYHDRVKRTSFATCVKENSKGIEKQGGSIWQVNDSCSSVFDES